MCVTEACALLAGCHDRENCFFSASPPIQGELETVDMIEKRFPQHLKKLFSVRFSHWLDSLLDDQPDWLQVIDSCLYNRSWPSTDWQSRPGEEGGGGEEGTRQNCIRGSNALRSNPLPFYIPFLTEKVSFSSRDYDYSLLFSYTFNWSNSTPFTPS